LDFKIELHIENESNTLHIKPNCGFAQFLFRRDGYRFRFVILNINHSKAILRRFCDMVSEEKSGKIELNEMDVINPKSSTVEVIANR
jgi:hypothetical protein